MGATGPYMKNPTAIQNSQGKFKKEKTKHNSFIENSSSKMFVMHTFSL